MTISYMQVLDKIKTDIWDVYSENSADFSNTILIHYNFYSWLCSDISAFSTYDSPIQFANELMKLTQQIIENDIQKVNNDKKQIELDLLTEQNTLKSSQNIILGELKDDIRVIKQRSEDDSLGIVTKPNVDKNKAALLRMALKDSNMIDNFNRAYAEEQISPIFKS